MSISCTGWIGSIVDDQRIEYDKHDANHDSCNDTLESMTTP